MTTLNSNTSESRLDEAYQRVDSFIEEHLTCSGIDFSFPALDGTAMQPPEGSRSTSIRFSNGPPLFDLAKLPYYGQSSKVLRKEIWGPGVTKRRFEPKKRGNYVRNSVLSNLRIEAKMTRLPMTWNLETLWDRLPAELLISIFSFLHPIDLYHAICASKVFRHFLLARNSTSIWRKSFLNHPDIPLYPKDVSAPKWSSWIFGPANCDTCGEGNCLFDYAYRYRKCDDCTDNLPGDERDVMAEVTQSIIGEFPNQQDNLWRLVMKTYRYDPFQYPHEAFYDEDDLRYTSEEAIQRAREMRQYLLDIQAGGPDALAKYDAFITAKESVNQERLKHAEYCDHWALRIYRKSLASFIQSIPPFSSWCQKILLKRGHHPRDVEVILAKFARTMAYGHTIWPATSEPKLRKSSLRKYLPQLESMIAICKSERLRKELDERINSRKEKIASFYSSFAKTFLTLEMMPYLPSPELLFDIKLFEDYIDDPKEVVVDLIAGAAQKEILRFIVEFFSHKRRQLLELLLETDLLPEDVTEDSSPETFLGLGLAAFECCGNAVFITWKEAGIHVCQEGGEMTQHGWGLPFLFSFSDVAYSALCKLSAIVRVDPQSISANDLDTLNRRFVCKGCKFTRHALMQGLLSMTWRECLVHAVQLSKSPPQDQHIAEFDILTEDVTKSILAVEQPFPSPAEKNWCCRHCHIFSDPVKKAEAIAHARTAHSIKAPVSGKDFAYCATEHSPIRPRVFIGLDENSNHRCLRCPASKSLRLWGKEPALLRHLLDGHKIHFEDAVENLDWMKVKAVEDNNWIQVKTSI